MRDRMEKRNVLFSRLKQLNDEINELRSTLNELNLQKEKWFVKKEELNSKISKSIGDVKNIKNKRDNLTNQVKDNKKKRQEVHTILNSKIVELNKLEGEKKSIVVKYKITSEPKNIQKEINNLEMKIETEVMSFENEKKMMHKIKQLKKNYGEALKISHLLENINNLRREIKQLKGDSDQVHKTVQNQAQLSQEHHVKVISHSEEVKIIRQEEQDAFEKFIKYKKDFIELNTALKRKLKELNELDARVNQIKKERIVKKKERDDATIKIRAEDVENKLKSGKKLTTKDLLVFQGS